MDTENVEIAFESTTGMVNHEPTTQTNGRHWSPTQGRHWFPKLSSSTVLAQRVMDFVVSHDDTIPMSHNVTRIDTVVTSASNVRCDKDASASLFSVNLQSAWVGPVYYRHQAMRPPADDEIDQGPTENVPIPPISVVQRSSFRPASPASTIGLCRSEVRHFAVPSKYGDGREGHQSRLSQLTSSTQVTRRSHASNRGRDIPAELCRHF